MHFQMNVTPILLPCSPVLVQFMSVVTRRNLVLVIVLTAEMVDTVVRNDGLDPRRETIKAAGKERDSKGRCLGSLRR